MSGLVLEALSIAERKLKPGDRLGDYEILEPIAEGGMAEIHLARSTAPGDDPHVVIKRLHPHLVGKTEWVSMFIDEATIGGRIDHPDIGRVKRIVDFNGVLFLVMDYVDGKDLLTVFKKLRKQQRPFPIRHTLRLLAQAARALDYVHGMCDARGWPLGIIHRDISMSNIMVGFDGTAKLIDFGVAKGAERITETNHGVLKGKARYMSPEQVLGHEIDRRSDVFSLGIVLYEITTGTPLFRGKDAYDCMRRIVKQEIPRPKTKCGGYPAGLEAVVMRALDRDRNTRYATAAEFADDLDALANSTEIRSSSAEIAMMMCELYPRRRRVQRRIPTQPHYQFGALLQQHRKAGSTDWCPDTAEVSAFLDSALGDLMMSA